MRYIVILISLFIVGCKGKESNNGILSKKDRPSETKKMIVDSIAKTSINEAVFNYKGKKGNIDSTYFEKIPDSEMEKDSMTVDRIFEILNKAAQANNKITTKIDGIVYSFRSEFQCNFVIESDNILLKWIDSSKIEYSTKNSDWTISFIWFENINVNHSPEFLIQNCNLIELCNKDKIPIARLHLVRKYKGELNVLYATLPHGEVIRGEFSKKISIDKLEKTVTVGQLWDTLGYQAYCIP